MRTGLWVVAVALVAVLAAGCGGKAAEEKKAPEAVSPPQETGKVVIVGKDNVFEPASVEIKAGREYEFEFKNEGVAVHNLIIQARDQAGQDFTSDIAVNAGQGSTFKVKLDKEGTYTYMCTYHPEMKGEIKVTK